MPTQIDISLWRGNSAPEIVWTLADPAPPGAGYFLTVEVGGRIVLLRDTASGSLRLADGAELRWSPTVSDSRLIPTGRVARYEIEQRAGDLESTLFFGAVTGLGGANADAGAPLDATFLDASDPENTPLFLLGWIA